MTLNENAKRSLAALALLTVGLCDAGRAVADAPNEDDPGWSCVDDGNRVCGPGNDEGKPAGCYDDGGVMVASWPCTAWKPSDGWHHPDGTVTH